MVRVEDDKNVDSTDDSEANATKERNDDDGEDVEVDARTCPGPSLQHDGRQHRVAHQRHHTWPGDNGGSTGRHSGDGVGGGYDDSET